MKTYETVDDYLKNRKTGDRIVLKGYGMLNGLKHITKNSVYRVHDLSTDNEILLQAYRGRKILNLGANYYDQKIAVLTNKEFKQLPKY